MEMIGRQKLIEYLKAYNHRLYTYARMTYTGT